MKRNLSFGSGALFVAVLMAGSSAQAHIDMLAPLLGRQGDQKSRPCEGKARGPVYTFEPGAVITLGVDEGIQHDSYFRIAFDDDGTDGFKDPASIDPINPHRDADDILINLSGGTKTGGKCTTDPADKCGKSDFCNVVSKDGKATVLWDNLNPHMASAAKTVKWNVKLPNVECNNCTLQIIQVMEDIGGHGVFDNNSDLYYRCVDIVLKKGTGTTGPGNSSAPATNEGIDCLAGAPTGGTGGADAGAGVGGVGDAGVDAGTSGTAGGAGGTTGAGGAGGASGTTAGTNPGAAGGAGAAGGGAVGTAGGAAGGAAGTAGTTGAAGGGTTGGVATTGGAVTTGTTAGAAPVAPTDTDDGGCAVAFGAGSVPKTGAWVTAALALGLLLRRKRRS